MDFSKLIDQADDAGRRLAVPLMSARGQGMSAPELSQLLIAAVSDLRDQLIDLGLPRPTAIEYIDRIITAAEREWSALGALMVSEPEALQ